MLFKPTTFLLLLLPVVFGSPVPDANPDPVVRPPPNPNPGPFPPTFPVRLVGMNGQKVRTLSLNELAYLGGFARVQGCNGLSRQSDGSVDIAAFGASFSADVAGAIIAHSHSTTERIFAARGVVYNVEKVTGSDMGASKCAATQAVLFSNIIYAGDAAAGAGAIMPPRFPMANTRAFLYFQTPNDVINIQRKYIQADMVTIYANHNDLMKALEGYKKTVYRGQEQ